MTRQQTTVLWLGIILIGLNIVVHIADVKAVIFGGKAPAAKTSSPPPTVNPPLAPGLPGTVPPNSPVTVLWLSQDGTLPRRL